MQVTIQTTKTPKKKRHQVQARFDKLRERIEHQQRKNAKLSSELDELARWLETQRRELERDVLDESVRLARRLIKFFTRKSLSNWHREELVDWINEMVEQVGAINAEAGSELHQEFVDAMGVFFEMDADEMEARFGEYIESEEAEFELDDDDFDDDVQPDLFDEFEDEDDPFAAGGPQWRYQEDDARAPGGDDGPQTQGADLTSAGWLRSLFRRAAQALHPDRESDPEQRAHKQARMQDLLKARKDGDVLAIMELYAEASGESDMALAEEEMKQACSLMEQKLRHLMREGNDLQFQSPLHTLIYNEFFRMSQKKREQKIKRWEREARAEAKRVARISNELKNLTVLKDHLRRRREEAILSPHDLDNLLDDLLRG